jgi:hypothetical protein
MADHDIEPAAYFCTACQEGWSFRTPEEEARAAAATHQHVCPVEAGNSGWVIDLQRRAQARAERR